VGTGLVGAPACGDVMKLQIEVSPEGIITDASEFSLARGRSLCEQDTTIDPLIPRV